MKNCFRFKLVDLVSGTTKKGDTYYKAICYCNFGFIVNIYLKQDKYSELLNTCNDSDFDINEQIDVFYDNNKQCFVYIIK